VPACILVTGRIDTLTCVSASEEGVCSVQQCKTKSSK